VLLGLGAFAAVRLADSGDESAGEPQLAPGSLSTPTVAGIGSAASQPGRTTRPARPARSATSTAQTTPEPRTRSTRPPAAPPETTPADLPVTTLPPAEADPRTIAWAPRPGTVVYWFELYRQGSLGARKILEARPTEARFVLPLTAPDGTELGPGLYSWSAAPQQSRRARVRYTGVTRAGRFRITPAGHIVPAR
jgi:hypothetical protein